MALSGMEFVSPPDSTADISPTWLHRAWWVTVARHAWQALYVTRNNRFCFQLLSVTKAFFSQVVCERDRERILLCSNGVLRDGSCQPSRLEYLRGVVAGTQYRRSFPIPKFLGKQLFIQQWAELHPEATPSRVSVLFLVVCPLHTSCFTSATKRRTVIIYSISVLGIANREKYDRQVMLEHATSEGGAVVKYGTCTCPVGKGSGPQHIVALFVLHWSPADPYPSTQDSLIEHKVYSIYAISFP